MSAPRRVKPFRNGRNQAVRIPREFELAGEEGSARLTAQVEAVLGVLDVLPLEAAADAVYGALRARLQRTGQPIGGNDLLVAAQTVALGYTLVTNDEREFTRIAELPVENRLR